MERAVRVGQTDGPDVVGEVDRGRELQEGDVVVSVVRVVAWMADDVHDGSIHLMRTGTLFHLTTEVHHQTLGTGTVSTR